MLAETVPPEPPPVEVARPGMRLADVVRDLAAERTSGTLVLPRTGERLVLREGRVVLADSPHGPTVEDLLLGSGRLDAAAWTAFTRGARGPHGPPGMSIPTWERMCRETTLDAAVQVFADDPVEAELYAGPAPCWTDSVPAITPGRLLHEVGRRKDVLRRLRPVVTPRTVIVKTRGGIWEKIQLTGTQWALLVEVQDGATPLEVAPRIGQGSTSTTLLCYGLMRLGLLRSDRDDDLQRTEPVGPLFL